MASGVVIVDVAPGLWIWRVEHPTWEPGARWERTVTCTCVESAGEIAVLDGLAPSEDTDAVWERLAARPPTLAIVLKPDHVRDVDVFVDRYGARGLGPWLFWRANIPKTSLEPIEPGTVIPGGFVALADGRGRNETPLWLPEQRTIVFADALTAPRGDLRVSMSPARTERVLAALSKLLELPFERVIVSHGEPVHSRVEYEHALNRASWQG
jgi:hypothetical protein